MLAHLKDLTEYKELLFNLAKKELKIKYKNSVLGFFWSLLNPILTMLVFSLVFVVIFKFKGIEYYSIFLLAGLLPWNFFNASVMGGAGSIIANSSLVKKVYFPRELIPLSVALANLVNLFLELLVFLVFITVVGFLSPQYFAVFKFLPYLLVLLPILFLFSVGLAFLVAALNVYLRDIQHIITILLMVWFYSSPIIYKIEGMVPPKLIPFYKLNPMTDIILSFKNVLYWRLAPQLNWVALSLFYAIVAFLIGYAVFLRLEPDFAEEL